MYFGVILEYSHVMFQLRGFFYLLMPRNRVITPQFWHDEKVGNLTEPAALSFIGMLNYSDDYGVVRGNPNYLKSQIFPYKYALRAEVFSAWLKELETYELIIPLIIRDESYYFIRSFRVFQHIEKPSKTRNCQENDLTELLKDAGYQLQQDGVCNKLVNGRKVKADKSPNSRGVVVAELELEVKEELEVKGNRAIALLVSGETTAQKKRRQKNEYHSLVQSCEGIDRKEAWGKIKDYIVSEKPEFIEPYFDLWNLFAHSYRLSTMTEPSDTRVKKFATRIQEKSFDFIKILDAIRQSVNLRGSNKTGWKVTFDYIMENDTNYLKIIEGN